MSSLLKIKALLPSLTETEKKVAQYILEHKTVVIQESVQVLAQKMSVSTATLVRFSQKLGYSGLTALKLALAQEDEEKMLTDLTEGLAKKDTVSDLIQKTYHYRLRTLEKTVTLIDEQQLNRAIALLKDAKRVYLIGIGGSGIVCSDLYHKLTRIGYSVVYTTDAHVQIASLNGMTNSDVLIAISYSGETKEVVLASRFAKEKGAHVIAITQVGKNTLSKLAEIVCVVPNEEKVFRIGAVSSRDTSLYIADLLYMGVMVQQFDQAKEHLTETKQWISQL